LIQETNKNSLIPVEDVQNQRSPYFRTLELARFLL
jgi:hypothetical protein